jgi:hypothetical protein
VRSTGDLLDISEKMNNCVASYWEDALKKKLTVMLVYSGTDEVCMGIASGRVVQAKGYRNTDPSEEAKKAIISWTKKHDVDPICVDLLGWEALVMHERRNMEQPAVVQQELTIDNLLDGNAEQGGQDVGF